MIDKVQKIRKKIEIVINRRLNLLNGDYFDLNKEADGFTNEIMGIIGSLEEEPVSNDLEKIVEEIAEPTILNAYGTKELARRLRNTICDTSVSEDLEKAEKEWLTPQLDKSYADYGETKMMELTRFDGYAMLDAIEFGAKWQKDQMMTKAINARCFGFQGDALFSFRLPADNYLVGSSKKVIVINEDEL